jgi:hypothetical protein
MDKYICSCSQLRVLILMIYDIEGELLWDPQLKSSSVKTLRYRDISARHDRVKTLLNAFPELCVLETQNFWTRLVEREKEPANNSLTKLINIRGGYLPYIDRIRNLLKLDLQITNRSTLVNLILVLPQFKELKKFKLRLHWSMVNYVNERWRLFLARKRDFVALRAALGRVKTLSQLEIDSALPASYISDYPVIKSILLTLPMSIRSIRFGGETLRSI